MTNESKSNPQSPSAPAHNHEAAPEQKPISSRKALLGLALVLFAALLLGIFGTLSRRSANTALAERTQELAAPSVTVERPTRARQWIAFCCRAT